MKEMTIQDLSELVARLSREGRAPELDVVLAAARAGRLYVVDTKNAGEDAILVGDDADDVLAEVAEHAREHDSEEHPEGEGRAAWARESGWTAERIVVVG